MYRLVMLIFLRLKEITDLNSALIYEMNCVYLPSGVKYFTGVR